MKLSIIIPVYNEEKTIQEIINQVLNVKMQDGVNKEIIVVNDGSSDSTAEILNQISDPEIKKFELEVNQGKTAAVKRGIAESTGDVIVIQDADLEYHPDYFPKLIEPILQGEAKIVYGSRFMGRIDQMEFINRAANTISNITINLLYGSNLTDFHTCYKMFVREIFDRFEIESKNFTFDTEITAKVVRHGYTIKEIPIEYEARPRKEGKKITWGTALEAYYYLLKYRFTQIH